MVVTAVEIECQFAHVGRCAAGSSLLSASLVITGERKGGTGRTSNLTGAHLGSGLFRGRLQIRVAQAIRDGQVLYSLPRILEVELAFLPPVVPFHRRTQRQRIALLVVVVNRIAFSDDAHQPSKASLYSLP